MHSLPSSTASIMMFIFSGLLVGLALGYLVAMLRQGRKMVALTAQLEQGQQALVLAQGSLAQLQTQATQTQSALHQQELVAGRLSEQIHHTQLTQKRLMEQLDERNQALASVQSKLEDSRQQQHLADRQRESAEAEGRALKAQVDELRERLTHLNQTLDQERAQLKQLQAQYTRLETAQQEREASHSREVANFEKQKASLSEQFKVLSNEILEAKTLALQESSKLSLSAVINPFQQSMDMFKKEVQDIHHRETTQQGELRKELASLKELNLKITTEAHELSTALRGQKKLQGNWGELVLENVLDRSGLQLGKDYQREVSISSDHGRQRPDAVVYLPQGKHLIIDAKVSLNAYTRYINAEHEMERAQALKEHVLAVASRIKELADRDYYKLPGLNSPEMVFMFIPIESAFVEALKADETLFTQAIDNNVLVATPTTLLTSLNIVRQLWRYEDQNKHTAALAHKAEAVFKKLNSFLGSFEKIKKSLESATDAYHAAETQLLTGKGNLVKQVSDFKRLAPAIKAELPSYFVDKAELEIDLIAEDVEKGEQLGDELSCLN
jgi:DNA recombination protein RmuC